MANTKVEAGTTAHCNRCDKAFTLKSDTERGPFCGSKAARIDQFIKCPHCGQTDTHWIFASDIAPEFDGGFDTRKRALRAWLTQN